MQAARVDIAYGLLQDLLDLPPGIEIKKVYDRGDEYRVCSLLLEGPGLPFTQEGYQIPVVVLEKRHTERYSRVSA